MTRARAIVAAVPQRVWTAVAGLALLASLAVAAVIGAGLSVWRSAVGDTAQAPRATIEPPNSGLIVLPGGQGPRPVFPPHPLSPSAPSGGTTTPVTVGPVALVSGPTGSGPTPTEPPTEPPPTGSPAVSPPQPRGEFEDAGERESQPHARFTAHAAHLRHEIRAQHRHEAKAEAKQLSGARYEAKHAKVKAAGKHAARHTVGKHRDRDGGND
jgi:hypothetical protein